MVVVDAIVNDSDLHANAGVVLPGLRDIDARRAVGEPPFPAEIGIGRQRFVPSRRVQ